MASFKASSSNSLCISRLIIVACGRCGQLNNVPVSYENNRPLVYERPGQPMCGGCREPLLSGCHRCNMKLGGNPKLYFLEFSNRIYCFACSKKIAPDYAKTKISRYDHKKSLFDKARSEFNARHSEWSTKKNEYLNERKLAYYCGVALPIVSGYIASEFKWSVWFGALVGLIVWIRLVYKDYTKRGVVFCGMYQEPKFEISEPPYPQKSDLEPLPPLPGDGTTLKNISYRQEILERDKCTCQSCGEKFELGKLEVHHIIPKAHGGEDLRTNLITLCVYCHSQEDWYGHIHKYRLKYQPSI